MLRASLVFAGAVSVGAMPTTDQHQLNPLKNEILPNGVPKVDFSLAKHQKNRKHKVYARTVESEAVKAKKLTAYQASKDDCGALGDTGKTFILYNYDVSEADEQASLNSHTSSARGDTDIIVENELDGHIVVGSFSAESVHQFAGDVLVKAVEADCKIAQDTPMKNENPIAPKHKKVVAKQGSQPSGATWGIARIDERENLSDQEYSWGTADGSGAVVYVLDTGINIAHNDFGGRAIGGWSSGPSGSGCMNPSQCDDGTGDWLYQGVIPTSNSACSSHGTHCAGTIGGTEYGVAKGTTVVAVQALSCGGSGSWSGVINSIAWAAADSANYPDKKPILSMSLGGSGTSSAMADAVDAAQAAGAVVVVAAGNSNSDSCNFSPAFVPSAYTVGATNSNDARASFSNYGSCNDIFAPGVSITSASVGSTTATETMSGTSMAAPHVAGALAQLWSKRPDLSPADVLTTMTCMSTKNAISDVQGSPNDMLYAGDAMDTDAVNCVPGPSPPNFPPPASPAPLSPPAPCDGAYIKIKVDTGSYGNEVSVVVDGDENMYAFQPMSSNDSKEISKCLSVGAHSYQLKDTYGDGWNGGTFYMYGADGGDIVEAGFTTGHTFPADGSSVAFSVTAPATPPIAPSTPPIAPSTPPIAPSTPPVGAPPAPDNGPVDLVPELNMCAVWSELGFCDSSSEWGGWMAENCAATCSAPAMAAMAAMKNLKGAFVNSKALDEKRAAASDMIRAFKQAGFVDELKKTKQKDALFQKLEPSPAPLQPHTNVDALFAMLKPSPAPH